MSNDQKQELKSCPHCGGEAVLHRINKDRSPAYVDCKICRCGTRFYDVHSCDDPVGAAIADWNARVNPKIK